MSILFGFGIFAGIYMLWLLVSLATFALPLYVGLGTIMWMLHHDHGYLTSIGVGILAGAFTLVAGQILFDLVRSPILRLAIALLFVLPAGFAGYQAVYGLAGLAIGKGILLVLLSTIGGCFIAASAWARLTSPLDGTAVPRARRGTIS